MPKKQQQKTMQIESHLNAPKLRIDTWNLLAEISSKLFYTDSSHKDQNNLKQVLNCFQLLQPIEYYHAFPGLDLLHRAEILFHNRNYEKFHQLVTLIVQGLRPNVTNYQPLIKILQADIIDEDEFIKNTKPSEIHYFEVLIVEDSSAIRKEIFKKEIEKYLTDEDNFVYEFVFVNSAQDALIAVMFNFNIKSCLISDFFKYDSKTELAGLKKLIHQAMLITDSTDDNQSTSQAVSLAKQIRNLRGNELDIFYKCSRDPEKSAALATSYFNKVFYDFENNYDLHLSVLRGIKNRYETPFFDSLKKYAFEPKSSFHALPIARGKSVFNSKWIQDMHSFYGNNIFLAESSATAGGLDSLMNPIGSISMAMQKAKEYFGSHETYFVTNGTSASNKIVLQTLLKPGDIVLMEHSCHESHHYGIILTGAYPLYLNGYRVESCDIAGPVPLRTIKEKLLQLQNENLLDRVKLLILSNCTFDGLVYNVQQYMEEILAIKPDMVFLWDEAWFSFARCVPHYRLRTAMHAAKTLEDRYQSTAYLEQYENYQQVLKQQDNSQQFMLDHHILPDPNQVKIRVYATQSTHKSLSCLRQGSMIHIYDRYFNNVREDFIHAYVTYSTTSPNYQIIATMDLARRQAELEGFELVQHAIELSMIFRQQINNHPFLNQYFQAAGPSEIIPAEYRQQSKVKSGYDPSRDWGTVELAWIEDEIVIDPTRVTLIIKKGVTGYLLRKLLMDRFGIQVNKVSFTSILLQFNIGTLRTSVSYLLDSLFILAKEFEAKQFSRQLECEPFLPHFSGFSMKYLPVPNIEVGDLRRAYYDGRDSNKTEYLTLSELTMLIDQGRSIICASLIIPTPPGYPILLPGMLITKEIVQFIAMVDPTCILGGYSPTKGIRVFREPEER